MLSRIVSSRNGVFFREGVERGLSSRWADLGHNGRLLSCAYSSTSEEDLGRQLPAPSSVTPQVTIHEKSSAWERFKPGQFFSRIASYFRSSTPIRDVRNDGVQDSFVVFIKGEECQKLSAKELRRLLRSMGQNVSEDEVQEIMKVANNAEGGSTATLDFPTFVKHLVGKMEGSELEKELLTVFKGIDKDEDGFISANDLRNAMSDLGVNLGANEFEELVRDTGGVDGRLNFEDFVKAMMAQSEFWQ